VLVALVLACGGADARTARRASAQVDMAVEVAHQIGSHAELISRINEAADSIRAEMGTNTKGYLCKTIYLTDPHAFPYSQKFMASKYGQWVPKTSKSVSIFFQGEASAKAFVGISAGVGVGLDMTLATGTTVTGQVRLFACLGASLSLGFVGASAFAGAGVLVGFGTFKDSIVAANIEVSAEVAALGAGGVGILLDVQGSAKTFAAEWKKFQAEKVGPPAATKEYAQKCWTWFKSVAVTGGKAMAKGTIALIKGVHVSGGVGAGGGGGASVDIDGEAIIEGVRSGFKAVWGGKVGSWVKDTKAWGVLKAKLEKVGQTKFGRAWKKLTGKVSSGVKTAVDKTNQFFDYVPLTE